jgi:hypothetical protein
LDFLKKRRDDGDWFEFLTKGEGTVSLIVKASDRFDLEGKPQVGFGGKWVLDVVDDSRLLRLLERQEVAQRRRLEQIYLEIGDARDYLHRTNPAGTSDDRIMEPGDVNRSLAEDDQPRDLEFRLLFAQRAIMQTNKAVQEIMGVADAFENIRLQFINNRIDSRDRKYRLSEQIEKPLREISGPLMSELKTTVLELETNVRELQTNRNNLHFAAAALKATSVSIEQIEVVRLRLKLVLDSLVKYETQNELLEIVRKMIKEQQMILDKTQKERQKRAFEGLLD